ncbi:MAG: type II secretion system secretin GspD [Gammaproteobacteria bacterium]
MRIFKPCALHAPPSVRTWCSFLLVAAVCIAITTRAHAADAEVAAASSPNPPTRSSSGNLSDSASALPADAPLGKPKRQDQEAPGPADNRRREFTPNFVDADLTEVARAVGAATGRNFVLHPSVRAQVTLIASHPMSSEELYGAFLSVLQVHGFAAMPADGLVKIIPDANARVMPDEPRSTPEQEEIVTRVIDVRNVNATQLVPILRPLVAQYGHMAAFAAGNSLIVSDRASNVDRITRIIRRVDLAGDQDVEIVPLRYAFAPEVVRAMTSLQNPQAAADGAPPSRLVADERSNSVLISGDASGRLRMRAMVALLDTPVDSGGETQVRYLKFADAEKLAAKLKEQISGIVQTGTAGPQSTPATAQPSTDRSGATIWADAATNALIVAAPPKVMRAVMSIVDKLDIRRAQVLVEAVIVEVNADKTSDLGVNWAAWSEGSDGSQIPAGSFVSPVGGSSLVDLYSAVTGIASGTTTSSTALNGTTIGIGRLAASGINFGAVLRALSGDAATNIVATPSAVTMDNQEAELKVAQEVPFVTGQYASTATTTTATPFTTVQREEVGTILKVTPQVAAEGNVVVLKISLESSSVAATSVSTVDITTNKRTVSTSVLIEDGGVVVLGGLIQESASRSEQRVPFLGSIPGIGMAFRARNTSRAKTNLMVFIRPKILRDAAQAANVTGGKYNHMLDEQRKLTDQQLVPPVPMPPP